MLRTYSELRRKDDRYHDSRRLPRHEERWGKNTDREQHIERTRVSHYHSSSYLSDSKDRNAQLRRALSPPPARHQTEGHSNSHLSGSKALSTQRLSEPRKTEDDRKEHNLLRVEPLIGPIRASNEPLDHQSKDMMESSSGSRTRRPALERIVEPMFHRKIINM